MSIFSKKVTPEPIQPALPGFPSDLLSLQQEIARLKAEVLSLDADLTREVKRISRLERKVYRNNRDEDDNALGTSDSTPLSHDLGDMSWIKGRQ